MEPITYELIQEIKSRIISGVHPEKIILFGSYARGEAHEGSDIDLMMKEAERWLNQGRNDLEAAKWNAEGKFFAQAV